MQDIIPTIVLACILLGIVRVLWASWRFLVRAIGPVGALGVLVALGWACHADMERGAGESSAARYRAAASAVSAATGRPCDYACKVAIADQGRRVASD